MYGACIVVYDNTNDEHQKDKCYNEIWQLYAQIISIILSSIIYLIGRAYMIID